MRKKTVFRLDTTATPERADGKPLDSDTIMEYGISPALEDGIIKSVVVYQPDPKIIELTYSSYPYVSLLSKISFITALINPFSPTNP